MQGQLPYSFHVTVFPLLSLEGRAYFRYFIAPGIGAFNDIELPFGGIEVGCTQDPLIHRIAVAQEMVLKSGAEVTPKGSYNVIQLSVHPVVQLPVFRSVLLYLVEHLWLQVSDDKALQELEQATFDNVYPSEVLVVLFELPEHVRNYHLVSLLIELSELDGAYLVVPPLHVGSVIDPRQEFLANQHLHYCIIHNWMAERAWRATRLAAVR